MLLPEETILDPLPLLLEALEESAWETLDGLRGASLPADERLARAAAVAVEAAARIRWLQVGNPRPRVLVDCDPGDEA